MSDIGKLRRSGLVSTFGPGAVVDFRAGDAAVSGVIAGLEEWDRNFGPPGSAHPQSTHEPRLMQKLQQRGFQITGFRLPPVLRDQELEKSSDRLVAVEFPRWHQCPSCNLLGPARLWARTPGSAAMHCPECSEGHKVYVVPVRFVMACEHGHLQDFPWHFWTNHKPDCRKPDGFLRLETRSAGLVGIVVSCPECKASANMEGIFAEQTWTRTKLKCQGLRPWLAAADQPGCTQIPRAMQRGATNLYFPVTESSLDIPPWSDRLQSDLGQFWHPIVSIKDAAERRVFISALAGGVLKPTLDAMGWSVDRLAAEIDERLKALNEGSNEDLRAAEYRQFTRGRDTPKEQGGQFEIRTEQVPEELGGCISRIVRAVRLREVRVLTGFTRINPPSDLTGPAIASISKGSPGWLPAIEVFGEGIFIDLDRTRLETWENHPGVKARTTAIDALWTDEHKSRFGEEPKWKPSTRFILIHTLAHALMRQLTLDCGYSTASLRERLYVGSDAPDMAGFLIYTSTTDADGTLGGLQQQGLPDLIRRTVPAAIHALEWCSSDPLCISGHMSAPAAASGAACHACVLAPETACEHFNRLLDRAFLVGTPEAPEIGFFHDMLKGV